MPPKRVKRRKIEKSLNVIDLNNNSSTQRKNNILTSINNYQYKNKMTDSIEKKNSNKNLITNNKVSK